MHKHSVYLFRFTVEGKGPFPFDMLRYDHAYPATQEDVNVMSNEYLAIQRSERHVNLRMYCFAKDGPTMDRWESFGWRVWNVEPIA
jgi:hypothetical protein